MLSQRKAEIQEEWEGKDRTLVFKSLSIREKEKSCLGLLNKKLEVEDSEEYEYTKSLIKIIDLC